VIFTAVAVFLLLASFGYVLSQKHTLNNLNKNIARETSTLEQKPEIGKILTVQNQLESLTALHSAKPAASRLFDTYLYDVTPSAASINSLSVDFTQNTIALTGTADSLATVNKYVDTLKFTNYTSTNVTKLTPAFSNVVLTTFGLNAGGNNPNQAASFTINLNFDKTIFDITQKVNLTVPDIITTRSELDQPGDLFNTTPAPSASNGTSSGGH
jgi:hypothetical protein